VFDIILDIVFSPALWLSIVLTLVYGMAFYLWRGGPIRQLGRDLVAGLVGFVLGQLAGTILHFRLLQVGQIYLVPATAGAISALLVGRMIWRLTTTNSPRDPRA
jgi:hypothetical protein